MQNFKSYLLAMHIAGPKAVDYYLHWVTRFYRFLNKQPGDTITQQEMDSYLKHLAKSRESWQVDQAAKAISLYQFFNNRKEVGNGDKTIDSRDQWKKAADDMHKILRLMHRSYRTEKA